MPNKKIFAGEYNRAVAFAVLALGTGELFCAPAQAGALYYVDMGGSLREFGNHGSTTVKVSAGSVLPYPDHYANAFEQAIAGPNDLGVYGAVGASGPRDSGTQGAQTIVDSQLSDSLFLSGAPQSGILAVDVYVDGLNIMMSENLGSPAVQIALSGNTGYGTACVGFDSVGGSSCSGLTANGIYTLDMPYTLIGGNTVPFGLSLEAVDTCEAQFDELTGAVGSCFASTEYLHTAEVSSITVESSDGMPVLGANVTSLSGVSYSLPNVTSVPEPASSALLGAGLIGLLLLRRKRQS